MVVFMLAVRKTVVQTVKISKKFCVASYAVANKNKLIARDVNNDIHI